MYGLPNQLVTDNGSQFISDGFTKFVKSNGIVHIRTAVAHPAMNGLVERFNQTFKSSLRDMRTTFDDMNLILNAFLLQYRNTPHATTGETPSKLFLLRTLRTKLDLVKRDTHTVVNDSQMKQSLADGRNNRDYD